MLLDLAAPHLSLPTTYPSPLRPLAQGSLCRSGALSYKGGQGHLLRGSSTCAEGERTREDRTMSYGANVMTECALGRHKACQSHPGSPG